MGIFGNRGGMRAEAIHAPMAGRAVALTETPDPAFAQGMLGRGIAIDPADGRVYAPCDATVDSVFATGHAVTLRTPGGAELLIHVGLDTVRLEGKPFAVHVRDGERVKRGQLLIEADLAAIRAAGLSVITPVVVCNTDAFRAVSVHAGKAVTTSDVVIDLTK